MIVQALIHFFVTQGAGRVISMLPTDPTPPDFAAMLSGSIGVAAGGFGFAANWFPVGELGTAIVAMGVFMVSIHVFRLVAWLLTFVHVGGGD